MFSIFFLLFLAAFCDQVNSECLNTEGVKTAVNEWLDDKSTAKAKYGPIGDWEFCNDISFYELFYGNSIYGGNDKAGGFNDDISDWDTSAVTSMYGMFYQAFAFNQDISGWDTARVTSMNDMFNTANAFNQDISGWDTARVTDMGWMFGGASAFNQDIFGWDTAAVTIMRFMFGSASVFNQDISDWDTARVTNMGWMFYDANSFSICLMWDISTVEYTTDMFLGSNGKAGCTAKPSQQPSLSLSTTPSVKPSPVSSLRVTTPPSTTSPPTPLSAIDGFKEYLKKSKVPISIGAVLLCFAVVFAFHFSRKHAATSSAAQSISSSQGDHDNVDNNDDNGLRSRDRSQLSSDIVITPGKKPKPSEILDPPISNVGESQVFEAEVMATTTDLNVTEIRALLGRFKPEGYRPLRLLLVVPSRTISEEMLVSRIISSYEGYVEDGIGERTLAENLVKDYYILRD
eukprot:CAMPEP_0113318628 /NCGR_PEP_ID=MMETSP0010_2-20120614/13126_1 /TAXON_ID=216773 ORGANISM="Corethron hystrix, Strain 308" /NCGR_SAMPLE_ID=MMETSP0010_2 /ASSEMBLY_ACC=CAM_ASM_000155 /LENGTH=457 /DNA_ID=CAMNT_0000175979 /DNA_START=91 /DNA_END=1464 /DNA_ORIENTATION=+ /assembly_acc=CAM_ASM_000155